ncbi:MAG: bifunctional UDP-sugar hydrolase/5'-nucleotidase [Calditrichaceae bacterium]
MNKLSILFFLLALWIVGNAEDTDNLKLYICYTNDVHGGITEQEADFLNPNFPPMLGGGASAAEIIAQYREIAQENGDIFLLLDAGDIFQGTPVGTKTAGKAVIDYMNAVGYDAVTAGNHDFDLGKDTFINLTKQADFPILSANLIDKSTDSLFSYIKPYTIKETAGLRIGIFGITTEATEQMSFPQNLKGLDFTAELPAAQKAVDALHKKGVDIVIGLVHLGLPYDPEEGYKALKEETRQNIIKKSYLNAMEMAHYVKGIDILFGGHIHKGYDEPWSDPVNHTLVFQNYGNGGNLGMTVIDIDRKTKTIAGYKLPGKEGGLLLLTEDEFWPDPKVYASIKEVQNEVEKGYDEVIGVTEYALTRAQGEAPMNNLICDAMIEAAGADFSFTNFGGIRADLKTGPITPRDIFKVLPFGNSIVVLHLQGDFLKKLIEGKIAGDRSGLAIGGGQVIYDRSRPDGDKIEVFKISGESVMPDKIYRVATTDYLAEGNSGLSELADLPETKVDRTGMLLSDAVTQYIQNHSPLKIKVDGRWQKK